MLSIVEALSLPTPTIAESLPTTIEATVSATQYFPCISKSLAWLADYKVIGIEDPITLFALFADCDTIRFESVIKEEKWRKAMDDEIDAIERNDT